MFAADANSKPYPEFRQDTGHVQKTINHASTRLPEEEESGRAESRRGTSPSRSFVDAAVRGTPCECIQDCADIDRTEPSINSYPLVSHDASPSPSDLPSLLTWGTLLATPRAIDGTEDPLDGPSFSLPESKRRDEIGRKLGDKASRSMNERAKGFTPRANNSLRALAGKTQRPGNRTPGGMAPPATPRRQENLTPAAQRLLERSLGTRGGKSGNMSWSNTPRR